MKTYANRLMDYLGHFFVDCVYTASPESYPYKTNNKIVVGHAIDTDFFTIDETVKREPVVLCVGRKSPVKRHDIVEEVYKNAVAIYGKSPFTIKYCDSLTQEELKQEYQKAVAVIHPSETGSIDKVVLEALACGTPVVALHRTYYNILGEVGLTVTEQNPVEYLHRLEDAMNFEDGYSGFTTRQQLRDIACQHSVSTLFERLFGKIHT